MEELTSAERALLVAVAIELKSYPSVLKVCDRLYLQFGYSRETREDFFNRVVELLAKNKKLKKERKNDLPARRRALRPEPNATPKERPNRAEDGYQCERDEDD